MLTKKQILWRIFTFWYFAMAVFTFGYAASSAAKEHAQELIECRAMLKHLGMASQHSGEPCWSGDFAGARGLFAAVFWPLYWSWELQL